jgi:RNA polymerase sigma-70 factor (ECF subfamily)
MRKHEDDAIVQAIKRGNVERFSELLDKYQATIGAIVTKRIPEKDVEAVTHEIFVQSYRSLSGYSGEVPFGNWATRIAVRSCCNYWREEYLRRSRTVSIESVGDSRSWLDNIAGNGREDVAEHLVQQQDTADIMQWLLGQLSPEDRTLIESIYFEDMPLKEVAVALEWSLVKTKVRALRARRKMRQLLETIGETL